MKGDEREREETVMNEAMMTSGEMEERKEKISKHRLELIRIREGD